MSVQTQSTVSSASPRATGASRQRAESTPFDAQVLTAIALASIGGGAINVAAAATVGRSASDTLAFFVAAAAAQIVWGAVALVRAPRPWLALGVAGHLAIALTWVVSRTVGLPVGTLAGAVLPVGFPDLLATVLEIAVAVGAVALLARGVSFTRPARSGGTTVATAVVVGALAVIGVLAQTGAIGASSSGSQPSGGSTPSYGGAPSNGGAGSGGGYGY